MWKHYHWPRRRNLRRRLKMNDKLRKAIHKILVKDGDGVFAHDVPDADFMFLHHLANYARAKKESAYLIAALKALGGDLGNPPVARSTFANILGRYVRDITPEEVDAL